ncbi:MAG: dCTP deaminase [Nitrososphaeria archaeon]|jgi:dCTP deaminase|nr:dCTP deaminase [Nitrososphaerota archaeon]
MGILTHDVILKSILNKEIIIDPFDESIVRENGVDLRVGYEYAQYAFSNQIVDPCEIESSSGLFKIVEAKDSRIPIPPNSFVLLTTLEKVKLPDNLVGFCNLRSTLARYGLSMSPTIIDVGFEGNITIEIINTSGNYIVLRPGMRFLHVILATAEGKYSYKGTYLKQKGVTIPKGMKGEC